MQFSKVKKDSSGLKNKQTSSFQKVNVLKNWEKVPYSKSNFYNQLVKYSLFLVWLRPMINTEERTSHSITVHGCFRTHLSRSVHPPFVNRCFLKSESIILCLTYFYFHRIVLSKKYLEGFDGKSKCRQNKSQTEKNFGYSKVTSALLISHFRGMLVAIFRRIKCNEEYQVINCCFFKLTLYWNSVLKFIFLLNTPKTEIFYIFW